MNFQFYASTGASSVYCIFSKTWAGYVSPCKKSYECLISSLPMSSSLFVPVAGVS